MRKSPENDYFTPPMPNDSLFAGPSLNGAHGEPVIDAPNGTIEVAPTLPRPLSEIMDEHTQRVADRGELVGDLDGRNWPQGRILEAARAQFPELATAEEIERQENQRLADVRRQARKNSSPKRKRPTRFISPRDTGPPPHIAREMRGE